YLLFFFQAEDGIRDFHVTGVQTCALPISDGSVRQVAPGTSVLDLAREISPRLADAALAAKVNDQYVDLSYPLERDAKVQILTNRSEERRVGEECRSRWSADHGRKQDRTYE